MSNRVAFPLRVFLVGIITVASSSSSILRVAAQQAPAVPGYGHIPPVFVPNAGHSHPSVRYLSAGPGAAMFFTDHDVRLILSKEGRRAAIFVELVRSQGRITAQSPAPTAISRHVNDRSTTLTSYREIVYHDAWPGIDATFRDDGGKLTYEFLLDPGAAVEQVRLRMAGVERLSLDGDGNLLIETPLGTLIDEAPQTFQLVDGERRPVASRFVLYADHTIGFDLGSYDRTLPVLIDPSIVYASFLGGSAEDQAQGIAIDSVGAAFVAGTTSSSDFPVTAGVVDTTGADYDGFVAKIAPDGRFFQYVTYLGGASRDVVMDIAIDTGGNAYLAGFTFSSDFPVTPGAFRGSQGPTQGDGFVAKLNAHGTALIYSTYLGGNGPTNALDIAVDSANQAHVVGSTSATNLPTTTAAIRSTPTGFEGFLLKFNAQGNDILYGTYVGGNNHDRATALALDVTGNVYVTGFSLSNDLATTSGAPQQSLRGDSDAFALKINPAASSAADALIYSTYLGGSGTESGEDIALDRQTQAAYVALTSFSSDLAPGAAPGGVLIKLNPLGTSAEYVRNVGAVRVDSRVAGVAVDDSGRVFVAGFYNDSDTVGYVSLLGHDGLEMSRVRFDTTAPNDAVTALAVDDRRHAYVAGHTEGSAFQGATSGTPRRTGPHNLDVFVAKANFSDVATTNVAEDRNASSSSVEGSQYAPSRAFDGDTSTRWSSRFSDPQWIAVDLGQRYRVDRVVIHWETAYAARYELHISDDGANWYPLRRASPRHDDDVPQGGGVHNLTNLHGTGRFVRVYGVERATQWGYSIWEMQVFGTPVDTPAPAPGSINVARHAPAGGSDVEGTQYLWGNAVDDNMTTRWSSAFSDPQFIWVDLGSHVNIARLILRWETAYGRDYQMQVSDDFQTWTTVRTVTNGDGGVDDLTNINAVGRYVRMYGTRRGTPWGYSLWEFEVYGVIDDGAAPPPPAGKQDIVIYASEDASGLHGLSLVADSTAAGASKVSSADQERAWLDSPPAPDTAPHAVYGFTVPEAGNYRLWLRMRGQGDSKWNESVWVQFSHATRSGAPVYRIGSDSALLVNLENCSACGIHAWGWQDNSWWLNQSSLVQLPAGTQELQITLREDGVEFDQIVLSPERYLTNPPGPVKNDTTIVPKP